jgi:hypothetical protein
MYSVAAFAGTARPKKSARNTKARRTVNSFGGIELGDDRARRSSATGARLR